ncbi:3 beta-hydroxysteroid dehydrogenase/Delta 5--_4-isomerase type 2-like isoform X2 [Dreissena polymorpha]|uniref:3-beta hydroxysteroid dehydrogenase/isomerase domain-containing protein n=3 Tax=Dreissena polymorpha TaxID=45954 RepID=A0A9D4N026_DREPO|nr:3 beta-hydroxysteroid dehydrogenase/Delta 5-->4-isomerase type 2-like isoform X2 [Dreissena polymorpha]XP_052224073.1 3 beta-hydroxysteroid dehydrogenase/Delta 5-->4-isomerase type 2-like isoform X2 [Dreissena polymorpha]XP_052224079.1 3 beta-hydroxysteroid dehydrogenase/Delta 5-->4-isomerase type 2-like isoform X2 [Dreissena polymorpha]KAH3885325.1 hypothetical protein DPMN_009319 [Dreissena polymorpha]
MSRSRGRGCVVLITGGAGFLGQHVVGLLQARADHVTEVRVLDVVPFVNKLDYVHTKPLRSIVGSITDLSVLDEACRGVHSVIHIAGVPDASMFPNRSRILDVNVLGTLKLVLTALKTNGVQRLIYCSSMSVAIGYDNAITEGIDETCSLPSRRMYEPYATSKLIGERFVQAANGESFKTLILRPTVMYGELDRVFVTFGQEMARRNGGVLQRVSTWKVRQQQAYVGNVAWAFVCAEQKLYRETIKNLKAHKSEDDIDKRQCYKWLNRLSERFTANPGSSFVEFELCGKETSKNVYYIADDTPVVSTYEFQEPFLKASGFRLSRSVLPYWLALLVFYVMFIILRVLRLFGNFNYPVCVKSVHFSKTSFIFVDKKARDELGYSPIYSPDIAHTRSMVYYTRKV